MEDLNFTFDQFNLVQWAGLTKGEQRVFALLMNWVVAHEDIAGALGTTKASAANAISRILHKSKENSVLHLVREYSDIKPDGVLPFTLTPREFEALELIADGKTNRQMADVMDVSVTTANAHVVSVLEKLNVSTRAEAALLYLKADGKIEEVERAPAWLLTEDEHRVAQLIVDGETNRSIAKITGKTLPVVENLIESARNKIGGFTPADDDDPRKYGTHVRTGLAVGYVIANGEVGSGKPLPAGISDRQLKVMKLLTEEITTIKEIGAALAIPPGTANGDMNSLMHTLKVHTRAAVAVLYLRANGKRDERQPEPPVFIPAQIASETALALRF